MADRVPATPFKPATTDEEQYVTHGLSEWAAVMKKFYGSGAAPPQAIFASASAPPSQQCLWDGKHFVAIPYASSYPHGGIYAHPSMHQGALSSYGYYGVSSSGIMGSAYAAPESEGNTFEGYEQKPMWSSDRNIENLDLINRKSIECTKVCGPENSGLPQRWGMLGPSARNEADNNPEESRSARTSNQVDENGNSVVQATSTLLGSLPEKPMVTRTDNLSFKTGSRSESLVVPKPVKNHFSAPVQASCDGVVPQDEHELRRMKRKQSNRESARRSRLRRQKECEKLSTKVEELQAGNADIKKTISRIKTDINELITENKDIVGHICKYGGEDKSGMQDELAMIIEANDGNKWAVSKLCEFLSRNQQLEEFLFESSSSSTEKNDEICDTNGKGLSSEDGSIGSDTN